MYSIKLSNLQGYNNYSRSPNLSDLAFIFSILEEFLGFVGYFFLFVFGIGRFLTGWLEFTYLTRFARVFFLECETLILSIPLNESEIMSSWLEGVSDSLSLCHWHTFGREDTWWGDWEQCWRLHSFLEVFRAL